MYLKTDRLYIRPINFDDKEAVYSYRSDAVTNKYQGWIPKSLSDVEAFISKVSDEINVSETWYQLVIIESQTSKIIGDIGIHFLGEDNQQVEIGCTLNKEFQNKGFATESLKMVISYLFTEFNKHRVVTSIDPENINSINLVERLGFRKEAHFKQSIFASGKWFDDVVYAMLKSDWENQ